MKKATLQSNEFDNYYQRYLDKLSDDTLLIKGFEDGKNNIISFFTSIKKEKLDYRYQPEKWSIKEVLQHLIDTERIFMYRCFRIARRDATALAGFEQDDYIQPSNADDKSLENLLNEFITNRNHSIVLLQSLQQDDLIFIGKASGNAMSARAAAFIILGHYIWHIDVIKDKYLG
jgi:uncharacterized damage-inducible protein DinB